MKKRLALAGVMAFLCAPTLALDKDKKDEKKADTQPAKITLTGAQSKAIEEIDQQFQRLQEEAQKQAQILSARESGLLTAFVMGTKLEGKQYKLVKDKDGYAVEEVVPTSPEPAIPGSGAEDKRAPGQPNPAGAATPANVTAPPKKEQK